MRPAALLIALLALHAAVPSHAIDQASRNARVLITHGSPSTYDLQSWPPNEREVTSAPLKKRLRFTIRPGEEVTVAVANPNPFLYSYSLADKPDTLTGNAQAVTLFTNSLLGLINALEPARSTGGSAQTPTNTGVLLAALDNPSAFLQEAIAVEVQEPSSSSIVLQGAVERMEFAPVERQGEIVADAVELVWRNEVPDLGVGLQGEQGRRRLQQLLADAGIRDSREFMKNFKVSLARLYLFAGQIRALITQVDQGRGSDAKLAVEGWKLAELAEQVDSAYKKMDAVSGAVSEALQAELNDAESARISRLKAAAEREADGDSPVDSAETLEEQQKRETARLARDGFLEQINRSNDARAIRESIGSDPFFIALNFIRHRERDVRDNLSALRQFAADMRKVDQVAVLGTITYLDVALEKHRALTITKAQNIPDGLTPGRDIDVYEFDFVPYSAVQLGVGGALIYSFVQKSRFEAVPEGNEFRIKETENEYTGTNIAAMLTIVPGFWADSDFQGLFEVGVKPEEDLGLYAGMGIRFGNAFSFGGGIAFERRDQLIEGLRSEQLIPARDRLKTEKRFETGFYIHLTASADFARRR